MIAFSNYPTTIWKNVSAEASNLSKAIASRFWMGRLSLGNYSINSKSKTTDGNVTMLTDANPILNTAESQPELNASYSLITVNASNNATWADAEFPFRVPYNENGTIAIPSVIGYGTLAPVQIEINQISSKKSFSINVVNRSLDYTYAFGLGAFNTTLPTLKYYTFGNLPTGSYYIASLIDISNRHYGYALFYVPMLNVSYYNTTFTNGTFIFNVLSNGQPLSNATFIATIDGQYNESGPVTGGRIDYTLPKGSIIKYGEHNVTIHILNGYYPVIEYYNAPPGIPSIYIEMGVAAAIIVLLNVLLRAPNREDYYIDVSEVPPSSEESDVNVTAAQITDLFDTINMRRYWKYMPLTAKEIKSGISSNIRVNNIPVSVTLQNVDEILFQLVSKGDISHLGDSYLPKRWESLSKHDAEYLVTFRKLRDYLVKHAALFTDLDQASDADMVLTSKDRKVPIFIFSKSSGVRRINIQDSTKAFLVFISSSALYEFTDRLYSTYGESSEMLRIAIESGSITLVETDDLSPLLY